MKKSIWLLILALGLFSCNKNPVELEESTGDINHLTVLIEDALWKGEVGDFIRKKFAASVEGLPQEEPVFNLIQHTDKSGDDFFCKNRNILIVEKTTENFFEIRNDDFALNQNVIYISGKNTPEIMKIIEQQSDSIIKVLKTSEILEAQNLMELSSIDSQKISDKFGIDLIVSSDYNYVLEDQNFLWLRKEIQNGNANLIIYTTPLFDAEERSEVIEHITMSRDSIGAKYIKSREDEAAFMVTEQAYSPYFNQVKFSNRDAFETKGTWEIKNAFMSGPFINYTIVDKTSGKNLVIEGFSYSSSSKRDIMHELEAIIKSVKFK
jgi:hypothetical protein